MTESVESLERRIGRLRTAVREAVLAGDRERASALRHDLRQAEQHWEDVLADAQDTSAEASRAAQPKPDYATGAAGSLLPLREQVYEALSLLQVPAAPKLIATVHEAFFGATFPTTRVTSLKRDEERSFRTAPFARPYYICAALSADYLAPSRGLLAVSTWPLELRVIGSLSPRVDFLTAAIRVAEAIERIPEPPAAARRLLQRFAACVPGARSRPAAGPTRPRSARRRWPSWPSIATPTPRPAAPRPSGRAACSTTPSSCSAPPCSATERETQRERAARAERDGATSDRASAERGRAGRLDRLRGRALPTNHNARTIAALASQPRLRPPGADGRGRGGQAAGRRLRRASPPRSASRGSRSSAATRSRPR